MDPAQLVRMYAADVFALCRAMVRDVPLAEDLAQDTFARAFAALDGYRGEASPRTWLLKIARNRCLDHLAHVRRAPWGRDPDPDPDDHVMDQPAPYDLLSNRDDAERAMAALAETERALVVLHYGHGVGYPELADSFGIAQGAVRMRMSRALAKMRGALLELDAHEATLEGARSSAAARYDDARGAFDDELEAPRSYDDAARSHDDALDGIDTLDFEVGETTAPAPVLFPAVYAEPTPRLLASLQTLLRG